MTTDSSDSIVQGIVSRSTGSWYEVHTSGGTVQCTVRGRFRLSRTGETSPLAVGDRVQAQINDDGTGVIVEVEERDNKLVRRAAGRKVGVEHVIAANVDVAWCVQSVAKPRFNGGFLDRFLVMAACHGIPAGLVINKTDLIDDRSAPAIDRWSALYSHLGYEVLHTSARTHDGVDDLAVRLRDRLSVLTGPSGVGKSSLLNVIEPALNLRTARISERTKKGTHATTNAAFHVLSVGGFVIDTPGLREFGVVDLSPADLSHYFVDFTPFLHECRFPNCTHDHEPDCAVIDAVSEGRISEERWLSYLSILDSLQLGEKDVGR